MDVVERVDEEGFHLRTVVGFGCVRVGESERGKSVLHALSLCILDVRLFDGRSIAALVGLHADGGGIAFCDFRRHGDYAMIFPYFSSMEPVPSLGITALCRSEGDGKLLLFSGVFFDRPCCVECSSCNDVAVLVFNGAVQKDVRACTDTAGDRGGNMLLREDRMTANDSEVDDLLSCRRADLLIVRFCLCIIRRNLFVEFCKNLFVRFIPCRTCKIVCSGTVRAHGGDAELFEDRIVVSVCRRKGADQFIRNGLLARSTFFLRDLLDGLVLRRFKNRLWRDITVVCAVAAVDLAKFFCGKRLPLFDMAALINAKLHGIVFRICNDALGGEGGVLVFCQRRGNGNAALRLDACAAIGDFFFCRKRQIAAGVEQSIPVVLDGVCLKSESFTRGNDA